MSIFICPNCKTELAEHEHSFTCEKGHSFDKSKQGYVNLSLSQKSSQKRRGDDKLMVKSRTEFLSCGYYAPLLDALNETIVNLIPADSITLLDCGCGEGYYTNGIFEHISSADINCEIYGTDISKDAVAAACRRNSSIKYCVSSVIHLPVKTNSVDIITSIFAPHCDTEFYIVLKKGGILIRVIPLEKHLLSLKSAVYDKPYLNEPDLPNLFGFELSERNDIKYNFTVPKDQLKNLFMMTPYYYKTSVEDQNKLNNIDTLTTAAEFAILVYKKI